MAGDWIKVEHATLEKPEVVRMAELLGVKHDEMLGILLRFWVWLDRATSNGAVTHASRFGVDGVMHMSGFSSALEAVGWAKFDDSAVTMTVPNFARHNGNPAKTRVLGAERQRNFRQRNSNAGGVTKTSPREEKRREEITTKSKAIARVPLAAPNDEHQELASSLGVDCQAEFDKYRDHFAANGRRHKDEVAGFRNWLRRAATFARPKPAAKHDNRAAFASDILGAVGHEKSSDDEPRDITGQAIRVA